VTIVTIHQPNYLPWLGYFAKLSKADVFIILDDVQFSKGSYINRVRILRDGQQRWLTIPVRYKFGDAINEVQYADPAWQNRHIDILADCYRGSKKYSQVMPQLAEIIQASPHSSLSAINRYLIQSIADLLSLKCKLLSSSDIPVGNLKTDDRLIALTSAIAREATYLSGQGGSAYQNVEKFSAAGLQLQYINFKHPIYDQGTNEFVPGLSIVDALFHLGWEAVEKLLPKRGT
jgi:hypothetical protein